jgi:hypothetical protein
MVELCMEEVAIKYWSPHGRQEETKYREDDRVVDLTTRAATKVDLSSLKKCNQLMILNLSNNMLEELDLAPLQNKEALTDLRVDNNHLESLNLWPLRECDALKRLNLTQNRLKELDITPILVRSHVLLDSSVVIYSDSILQFFFTTNQLAERLLLIRPDGAPWTAQPVLMWKSYEALAKKMDWTSLRQRILSILSQVSNNDWYAIQRGLMIGLGMEELAGFDGNPSKLLEGTTESMDYGTAKRAIFDRAIELLDEQVEHGGPTLFLDTEMMRNTRASRLIARIADARTREIENAIVPTKGSTSLMDSLWLTHYGYKILEALGIGIRHFGNAIEQVKTSFEKLGFSLKTQEVDSLDDATEHLPVVASSSMKHYLYNQVEKAYL